MTSPVSKNISVLCPEKKEKRIKKKNRIKTINRKDEVGKEVGILEMFRRGE